MSSYRKLSSFLDHDTCGEVTVTLMILNEIRDVRLLEQLGKAVSHENLIAFWIKDASSPSDNTLYIVIFLDTWSSVLKGLPRNSILEIRGIGVMLCYFELTPNCMSKCLIVDVSPKEGGAECIPTTVLVHTQEQDILYESLPSSDAITQTVLNRNVPVPPAQSVTSRTMLVRKNERLQKVNLLTLNELTPSKEVVNFCGILVKRMGIQHCSSGDYKCNILLVDETTNVPFHVSVFFRKASSYSIFRCLGSPVFLSSILVSQYRDRANGIASSTYSGVTLFDPVQNKFESTHDLIDPISIKDRCIELYDWFRNLNKDNLYQIIYNQYCRKFQEIGNSVFDSICKVVKYETIQQDYIRSFTCFDESLTYTDDHSATVDVEVNDYTMCDAAIFQGDSIVVKFYNLLKK